MRSEKEMLDLILGFAGERADVLAVYMNGSRTNPNIHADMLQDFDIVFAVEKTAPFIDDKSWISRFGEIAVMQEPDDSAIFDDASERDESYAFLMQFADGNRIDLSLVSKKNVREHYFSDKLCVKLLDKTGILPDIAPPSDEDYWVKRPDAAEFKSCCNEFWWVAPYCVKGLWRGETLYAIDHLNLYVRPMLLMMVGWRVGLETGFSVSVGKCGKYLKNYLDGDTWAKLIKTYPKAIDEEIMNALYSCLELFSKTARAVGEALGFEYNSAEEAGSRAFMNMISESRRTGNPI